MRLRLILTFFGVTLLASTAQAFTVAAASDLQHALPEIEAARGLPPGARAKFVFGSSGTLYRQIVQGAPFEVFLSADEALAERLIDQGRADAPGLVYAVGRLALMIGAARQLELLEPKAALASAQIKRLAIANPEHAPYGRAAMETLGRLGLAEVFRGRLLLGENVSQAARFVLDGGAEAGLVALSIAFAAGDKARHVVMPATLHAPIRQRLVLIKGAGADARAFAAFMASKEAMRVLARHGFERPGS